MSYMIWRKYYCLRFRVLENDVTIFEILNFCKGFLDLNEI